MLSAVLSLIPYALLFVSLFFEVFLLVSFLERRFEKPRTSAVAQAALPSVAVVVPCFNEAKTIEATISSLLALEYPKELFEVLVVDDGSTDGTRAAAERFAADPRVRLFQKQNGGKHSAMNYALKQTEAELIGCLDADSIVATDALLKIAPIFADQRVSAVTPGIHVREPKTMLQHLQNVEYRISIFNRFILSALGSAFITPGPFSIFRTSVVKQLGGWRHGHSTEDMEMALRMQEHGHLIANAPMAVVHTTTPKTLRHLFHQRTRWTYGFLRNAADYRHMLWNRTYGNLGIIVLPTAFISIATALYFFGRMMFYFILSIASVFERFYYGGLPHPRLGFDLFFVNTSSVIFLVYAAIALVIALICAGSLVGTGSKKPPFSTPLFLLFYGFLAPFWLGTALIRAIAGTGVRWR